MRRDKTRMSYGVFNFIMILVFGMFVVFATIVNILITPLKTDAQIVESVANATRNAEQKNYFGVVTEIDQGMGVFALSWKLAYSNDPLPEAKEWAGILAEFKRRHLDLDVVSTFFPTPARTLGVVVITTPKSK